jgi:hypothetical protein
MRRHYTQKNTLPRVVRRLVTRDCDARLRILPQQDKLTLNQTVRQHEKNGVVNQFINRLNSYHLLIIY